MSKTFKIFFQTIAVIVCASMLVYLFIISQKAFYRSAYPVKYGEYVEKYSDQYGLDKNFVLAVIRTESDFVSSARSSVGARGLMQFTEVTFNWTKVKLKDRKSTFDSMNDPETAIKYGTFLLKYLSDSLGCKENMLCGYHAGINCTKQWLADSNFTADGKIIIDKIPYSDTRQYVVKVMKTYEIYKKLYK